ncbi:MAG: ABC transporter permease [Sandaracinaceae bacterium]|nr:ABC transporter permease [Sandaracinaceae bacterium]
MTGSVSSRYALRSLRRNLGRSLISTLGVGFGVGIGLLALSWMRGEHTMSINAAAGGGVGHLRVTPDGWDERRDDDLRLDDWEPLLERVRATEGVAVATPRNRVAGLLGLGTRSEHVDLTGVDPTTEPRALRYVRDVAHGRYLEPGERGAIVLGSKPARRLGAELGDELVVTALDEQGEMSSMLLVVVGIVETGSDDIDATIAHVALADVEQLSGRPGAGEITILADDVYALDALEARLRPLVPPGADLLTWLQVSPELRMGLEADGAFFDMAVVIILLVVLLGVTSAQLTGVLERRKEFAVLAAIGMRGVSLVKVVLVEGMVLGLTAAVSALAWAAPLSWKLNVDGVNLAALMNGEDDSGMAFGGLLIDPIFHPGFGAWMIPYAFLLALIATITASLYPAWFASRTDPAQALRVDR